VTGRAGRWAAALAWAAGAHSLAVGAVLLFVPALLVRVGWPSPPDGFFVMQGGAFHVVLGLGYLLEWRIHRRLQLLVLAKACAVAFLGVTLALGQAPPIAGLALAGDAAFLAAAALLERAVVQSRSESS